MHYSIWFWEDNRLSSILMVDDDKTHGAIYRDTNQWYYNNMKLGDNFDIKCSLKQVTHEGTLDKDSLRQHTTDTTV